MSVGCFIHIPRPIIVYTSSESDWWAYNNNNTLSTDFDQPRQISSTPVFVARTVRPSVADSRWGDEALKTPDCARGRLRLRSVSSSAERVVNASRYGRLLGR